MMTHISSSKLPYFQYHTDHKDGQAFVETKELQGLADYLCGSTPKICYLVGGRKFGKTLHLELLREHTSCRFRLEIVDCSEFIGKGEFRAVNWLGKKIATALSVLLDNVHEQLQSEIEVRLGDLGEISSQVVRGITKIRNANLPPEKDEKIRRELAHIHEKIVEIRSNESIANNPTSNIFTPIKETIAELHTYESQIISDFPSIKETFEQILKIEVDYAEFVSHYMSVGRTLNKVRRLASKNGMVNPLEFRSVGEYLKELPDNITIAIGLDNFDKFLIKGALTKNLLEEILDALEQLWVYSDGNIKLIQTFSEYPETVYKRLLPRIEADAQHPKSDHDNGGEFFRDWLHVWVEPNTKVFYLDLFSQEQIKEFLRSRYIDADISLINYLAREVFKETGGHPFLVQAICYSLDATYYDEDSKKIKVPIDWLKIVRTVENSQQIHKFLVNLTQALSRNEQQLLKRLLHKGKRNVGIIPQEIEWRKMWLLLFTTKRSVSTEKTIENIIQKPNTYNLILRKPIANELKKPYIIQIEGADDGGYLISSRFVWRQLDSCISVALTTDKSYGHFLKPPSSLQMTFLILFVLMTGWILLEVLNISTAYALILPIIILVFYFILFVFDKISGLKEDIED